MSTTTTPDTRLALHVAERDYEGARQARIDAIGAARLAGMSWEKIGAALGMSHVAARRLYLRNGGAA